MNLVEPGPQIVANLQEWAAQLIDPLQSVAVASIGIFGNILILVILSIYIALDREDILAFVYRLVPPAFVPAGTRPPGERRPGRSAASSAAS